MKAAEGVGVELGGVEIGGVEIGGVETGGVDMDGVETGGVETGGVETGEEGWESPGRGISSVFTAASVAQSSEERSVAQAGAPSRISRHAVCHSGDGALAQPPPTK